ncbi:ATP synthase subunit epsilon, mitochondrial [Trachymyrmex cornetzi]|uniref:ATP synthase subunit epsilon, mitochondrial n=1 Tax=Trachymyrmex cornetzi TaxID=471704 RepID=A0A195E9K2_9HYME|nr:ATP synthase subunit epsilon, mitochondrial [Trachymyrmex cornetzi]
MSAWRQAGLNYINYSQIAARLVRQALKADLRVEAAKRDEVNVKFTEWKDGKPISMYAFKFIISFSNSY